VSSVLWDPGLESILVCPEDLGPLVWRVEEGLAFNPRSGRGYHVEDGVARLLVSESFDVDPKDVRL
jgi:uncharacterized protein YbaR (Trm112 family)